MARRDMARWEAEREEREEEKKSGAPKIILNLNPFGSECSKKRKEYNAKFPEPKAV